MFSKQLKNIQEQADTLRKEVEEFLKQGEVQQVLGSDARKNIIDIQPLFFDPESSAKLGLVRQNHGEKNFEGYEALQAFVDKKINSLSLRVSVNWVKHPDKPHRFNFKTRASVVREEEEVTVSFGTMTDIVRFSNGGNHYDAQNHLTTIPYYLSNWWHKKIQTELEMFVFAGLAQAEDSESFVSKRLAEIVSYNQAQKINRIEHSTALICSCLK